MALSKPLYPNNGVGQSSAVVADVNADGKPDLILGGGQVGVLLGKGDGTFQFSAFYKTIGIGAGPAVVADVNRDGKLDILAVNFCGDAHCSFSLVSAFVGNGDGTFQPAVPYGTGGVFGMSLGVADLNGDGNPDVVVASCAPKGIQCGASQGLVSILPGKGDGTFHRPLTYNSGGIDARYVAIADVNSDGRPDLIVTDAISNDAAVLLNEGRVPGGH